MREAKWNQTLNKKLRPLLKLCVKMQVESNNGIVDNYYLGERRALWMEAKIIDALPKRDTTIIVPDCTELQYRFLNAHADLKAACVFVAVKKVDGHRGAMCIPYLDKEEWTGGISTAEAKTRLMSYDEAVKFFDRTLNYHFSMTEALKIHELSRS